MLEIMNGSCLKCYRTKDNIMKIQKTIMLITVTLFFLGILHDGIFAQNRQRHKFDSLKQVIATAKQDSNLIKTYLEIGSLYRHESFDSTLLYYRESLKLAEKFDMKKYIAQSLQGIGEAFYSQSDYDSALYYFSKALSLNKKLDDKNNIAKLYKYFGNIYINQSIYDKALEYELTALDIYKTIGNKNGYSSCVNNIGIIYYYQKNYEKALTYFLQSLQIKKEIDDKKDLAILLGNIGYLYYELGKTGKALEYDMKSIKIYKEIGDKNDIARLYSNIGKVYVKQKNYSIGLKYYKNALKLHKETGYKHGIILTLLNIGDLFNKTRQYNKALKYEFDALNMAMKIGELDAQKTAYDHITDSYKGLRNYKKALKYREKFIEVHDSIYNKEKANTIATLEVRYQNEIQEQQIQLQKAELEKNKAEMARLEAEKKRNESERNLFILAFILMIFLATAIFYFYRQKKKDNELLIMQKQKIDKINEELNKYNEELTATLEKLKQTQHQLVQAEKMASLGVLSAGIAHEINNPINFVYAGINSLLRDFEDIKPVIDAINKINPDDDNLKEKLEKVDQLKQENYFNDAFEAIPQIISDIKLGADRTAEIVKSLRNFSRTDYKKVLLYNIHEGLDTSLLLLKNKYKNNIEIIKNYDRDIPFIYCNPGKMNQVFLNILSNAIDAIESKGKIWITTSHQKDFVKISIKDNGCGMNDETREKIFDPFYTTKDVGKGTGLGMSITYGIIQEHGGDIQIISEPGKGTEMIITIPAKPDDYE